MLSAVMKKRTVLRAVRAAHEPKVSQSKIARKAGMGLVRYWQIENGEGPEPSDTERQAIAAALGVSIADIQWPEVGAVAS
jgi:transcriptional regulator with XRE-family HTH domain